MLTRSAAPAAMSDTLRTNCGGAFSDASVRNLGDGCHAVVRRHVRGFVSISTNSGVVATAILVATLFLSSMPVRAQSEDVQFDVNDVAFLWPVPASIADVDQLISADQMLDEGHVSIWPADVFNAVITQAQQIAVTNSAGRQNKIDFRPFHAEFTKLSTWKAVSFRVDPSAAGASAEFIQAFGEIPQIRLVLQPVTMAGDGAPRIHDVTVHLVFSFVKPPASPEAVPVPDREKFRAIVQELQELKISLQRLGTATAGKLSVHPGLKNQVDGFAAKVRSFLLTHLSGDKLSAVAFMGIDPPEPWIFFAMRKSGAEFKLQSFPVLSGNSAEMLILAGGTPVIPTPATTNVDAGRGVHTSLLFSRTARSRLDVPVFGDRPDLKHKDIPDLIANPTRSHFFNTDCVSCHTESSRRKVLELAMFRSEFQYRRPDGISPVDEEMLPKDQWNVRNFGWFPAGAHGGTPTITMRTANEAAESADFINRNYLRTPATTAQQK